MTFAEFLTFRNVNVRDANHERIVRLFYPYLESVTGDGRLLPDLIGRLLNVDLSAVAVPSACFNGIHDEAEPPYDDVGFYASLAMACASLYADQSAARPSGIER